MTLLCLCPATPIAQLLQKRPDLEAKIAEIVWMAGAWNVKGNLDPTTLPVANLYAEWNVFWDPPASDWLIRETSVKITVFPLDVTDQAKLDPDFLDALDMQGKVYPFSNLAAQSYALVSDEPFYEMWDVVTTCYLAHPEFFDPAQPTQMRVETMGDKEGAMVPDADARAVDVVFTLAQQQAFYDYVLQQIAR
ncbi:Inosine-uridine preferring nucleoside hydrolase [Candidatus Rhodobacter oscarellae]|uniref:Inosine-uridine preferring nucleoside hydrolase n=1 Tax=Candidatus Rhodobacter oscarellae TaxID=1675527 RepID=A0A0J9EA73_9RHOB|nr:nucleoside hydrolase [Candidatus Rhodobacter lobularis]KMW58569.1 Inosine-uridine preferring nucleoside hydrolase [Candidatus Rhodobacter lobularis]